MTDEDLQDLANEILKKMDYPSDSEYFGPLIRMLRGINDARTAIYAFCPAQPHSWASLTKTMERCVNCGEIRKKGEPHER